VVGDHALLITPLGQIVLGAEYYDSLKESGEPATKQAEWMDRLRSSKYLERDAFRAQALAHWNATQERTSIGWHLLKIPRLGGGTVPTGTSLTFVRQCLIPPRDDSQLKNKSIWICEDRPRNEVEGFTDSQWKPQTYEIAPISFRRRHQEEKLLVILKILERERERCSENGVIRRLPTFTDHVDPLADNINNEHKKN
jgi:amidase